MSSAAADLVPVKAHVSSAAADLVPVKAHVIQHYTSLEEYQATHIREQQMKATQQAIGDLMK